MARKAVSLEYGQSIDVVTDQGLVRITAEAGQKTVVHLSPAIRPGLVGSVQGGAQPKGRAFVRRLTAGDEGTSFDVASMTITQEIRRHV